MPTTTRNSPFRRGVLAGAPFNLMSLPFSMLFGLVATEAGLDVAQTLGMSILVIAGASQFTAVQLMTENAPVWIVLATALAVNLRMAMYSASLQPHLGAAPFWQRALVAYLNVDASYALSIQDFEDRPQQTVPEKLLFFLGTMTPLTPMWFGGTYLGAIAGSALPDSAAVDFAMPIMFLALLGPMLKTLAHLAAAISSVVAALALAFLPSGIGLLLAAFLAMAVGAEIERRRGR